MVMQINFTIINFSGGLLLKQVIGASVEEDIFKNIIKQRIGCKNKQNQYSQPKEQGIAYVILCF